MWSRYWTMAPRAATCQSALAGLAAAVSVAVAAAIAVDVVVDVEVVLVVVVVAANAVSVAVQVVSCNRSVSTSGCRYRSPRPLGEVQPRVGS